MLLLSGKEFIIFILKYENCSSLKISILYCILFKKIYILIKFQLKTNKNYISVK